MPLRDLHASISCHSPSALLDSVLQNDQYEWDRFSGVWLFDHCCQMLREIFPSSFHTPFDLTQYNQMLPVKRKKTKIKIHNWLNFKRILFCTMSSKSGKKDLVTYLPFLDYIYWYIHIYFQYTFVSIVQGTESRIEIYKMN